MLGRYSSHSNLPVSTQIDIMMTLGLRLLVLASGILLLSLTSCNTSRQTPEQLIETYYAGFNAGDFAQIQSVVADSFTNISEGYVTRQSLEDQYVMFQWDSVFVPSYTISDVEVLDAGVKAMVSSYSKRYAFLDHNPLTCEMTFAIADDVLNQLTVGECPGSDWDAWSARRDTLVAWIDIHHPELSGFIHDLTREGAENYLQAITLYERAMK